MLFTDANWAESSGFRRALAKPYQPWRCVGWTDESICFWVFPERESNQSGTLPDGLLVAGPEVLLEVVGQISPDGFSVYVMDANPDGESSARMQRLTALWNQPPTDATAGDYWYRTEEGKIRPCSRRRGSRPDDAPMELLLKLDIEDCDTPGIAVV
jgi:hypothetical protein